MVSQGRQLIQIKQGGSARGSPGLRPDSIPAPSQCTAMAPDQNWPPLDGEGDPSASILRSHLLKCPGVSWREGLKGLAPLGLTGPRTLWTPLHSQVTKREDKRGLCIQVIKIKAAFIKSFLVYNMLLYPCSTFAAQGGSPHLVNEETRESCTLEARCITD